MILARINMQTRKINKNGVNGRSWTKAPQPKLSDRKTHKINAAVRNSRQSGTTSKPTSNLKVALDRLMNNNWCDRCLPKHKRLSFPLTGLSVINSDYRAELSWPTSEATVPGVRSQRGRWLETATAAYWPNCATASSSLSKPTAGAIPDTLSDHWSLVCGCSTLTVHNVQAGGQQARRQLQ